MIQEILFKHFSIEQLRQFAKKYRKAGIFCVKIIPFYGNLNIIARVFGTDKNSGHSYTQHYMRHFKKFRFKKIKLLEIGVGGYDDPHKGGESLGMWKKYFPFGRIFSLDIYDKQALQESRIKIYQGSQVDPDVLSRITDENGTFDLIIDDGSHIN
ncbi:MAG: hypothetical protein LBS43_07020, partial [Prevotellaceae bacterium]|nr:hypothetical protein [Prevotellaceae bacterium]